MTSIPASRFPNALTLIRICKRNGNLFLGTDFTDYMDFLKGLPCHPIVEGSHIMLSHALREMSRQARHDRHHSFKEICLIRVIRA